MNNSDAFHPSAQMVETLERRVKLLLVPGLDGFEVCRRLKQDSSTRDIPVIFLTGSSDSASEEQGLDAGAVDFIAKPFNPKIVKARVKTHVTLKRQSDLLRQWVFLDGLTGMGSRTGGCLTNDWRLNGGVPAVWGRRCLPC